MKARLRSAEGIAATWLLGAALGCSDDVVAPTLVGTGANGGGAGGSVSQDATAGDIKIKFPDSVNPSDVAIADVTIIGDTVPGIDSVGVLDVSLPEVVLLPDGAVPDSGPGELPAASDVPPLPDGFDVLEDGLVVQPNGAPTDLPAPPDVPNPADSADTADGAPGSDAVLQGCNTSKDCPVGWNCVKTPVGKICAEPVCEPTGFELCDGVDNDCNGTSDDGALCNDGNTCTEDSCGGIAGCKAVNAKVGTGCESDGDLCTSDNCANGKCTAGPDKNCNDSNGCTLDLCDAGVCLHKPQGFAGCDDGNPCTAFDKCTQGVCQPGTPVACLDGNPCTDDVCFPNTGQCVHGNTAAGVPCTDGNACTNPDKCGAGNCAGLPVNCEDGNPCTSDTCAPGAGCLHSALNGAPCNDNNACTSGDVCKSGICGGGASSCDDTNPCSLDGCNPGGGCSHSPIVGACSDGNVCTKGETCGAGGCSGGGNTICNDGNACTNDTCDPSKGCQYAPTTAPCNDGNPCTVAEACQGGTCTVLKIMDCADGILCTADVCDPALAGCIHTPQVAACDDGDICTIDACLTATGCKHTVIEKCCGGKQCGATEVCIVYPDTLAPFCAKPCNSGKDCAGSCCYMTFKTKHCLVNPYLDQCCGTPEYWATDDNPYGCGTGGKGKCINYPNPQQPYYPSKILYCTMQCKTNAECPGSCCGTTTLGNFQCVNPDYKKLFCPGQ